MTSYALTPNNTESSTYNTWIYDKSRIVFFHIRWNRSDLCCLCILFIYECTGPSLLCKYFQYQTKPCRISSNVIFNRHASKFTFSLFIAKLFMHYIPWFFFSKNCHTSRNFLTIKGPLNNWKDVCTSFRLALKIFKKSMSTLH